MNELNDVPNEIKLEKKDSMLHCPCYFTCFDRLKMTKLILKNIINSSCIWSISNCEYYSLEILSVEKNKLEIKKLEIKVSPKFYVIPPCPRFLDKCERMDNYAYYIDKYVIRDLEKKYNCKFKTVRADKKIDFYINLNF